MAHRYRPSDMISWSDVEKLLGHWKDEARCRVCKERHTIAIVLLKDGTQRTLDSELIEGWPY